MSETLLSDIVFGCGTATAPFELRRLYQTEGAVWRLVTERPAHLLPGEFAGWDQFLLTMADRAVATCEMGDLDACVWGDVNRIELRHPLAVGAVRLAENGGKGDVLVPGVDRHVADGQFGLLQL